MSHCQTVIVVVCLWENEFYEMITDYYHCIIQCMVRRVRYIYLKLRKGAFNAVELMLLVSGMFHFFSHPTHLTGNTYKNVPVQLFLQ